MRDSQEAVGGGFDVGTAGFGGGSWAVVKETEGEMMFDGDGEGGVIVMTGGDKVGGDGRISIIELDGGEKDGVDDVGDGERFCRDRVGGFGGSRGEEKGDGGVETGAGDKEGVEEGDDANRGEGDGVSGEGGTSRFGDGN